MTGTTGDENVRHPKGRPRTFEQHADRALSFILGSVVMFLCLEIWGVWPGIVVALAISVTAPLPAALWGMWCVRGDHFGSYTQVPE